jgi:hypothetical protein
MTDVRATLVDSIKDLDASVPGAYQVLVYHSDKDKTAGMAFICPCGCGREGYLPFRPAPSPSWEFDGNIESPTLHPSIQQVGGCQWHGWLKAGVFVSC